MVNHFVTERDSFCWRQRSQGLYHCQWLHVRYFGKNVLVEDLAFYSAENTRIEDLILGIFC